MKSIKMLGLAALAALMAMAFVGASSAMATDPTALCKKDPGKGLHEACPAKELVEHVHEVTLPTEKATLLNSISNVLCDVLFLGDVITPGLLGKNTLEILGTKSTTPKGGFIYTNCVDEKNPQGNCTVEEVSAHTIIKVLKEGHETASVTGEGEVKVVCSGISCTYKGEGLKGLALGPLLAELEPGGEVRISEQETKKVKGLLCPATSKLDIKTTPLEETPTWITE